MQIYETDRLILRPFEFSDADDVERLAGDEEVARTTLNVPHPYPKGAARDWIALHRPQAEQGTSYVYAVERKDDHALIGCMALGVVKTNRRGELAYWFGRPYWNLGYATEAAKVLLKFGFESLNLNKVWAAAMTKNPGSTKVMENIGLQYEGCLKGHVMKWGVHEDLAHYGLLKSEYVALGAHG